MSSAKPKRSFPEALVVWETAGKETKLARWLDQELRNLEDDFADFITVQSARRAAKAKVAAICESR